MTPTKRTGKEAGDTRKQPLRKATAATANLTEMTSELEVAGPSSGKSSPKKATKRPVTLEEVESSTKKLKLPQEDTSDEGVGVEDLDPEKKFVQAKRKKLFADRTLIIKDFVEHEYEWIVDNKPHRFGKSTNICAMILYLSRFIPLRDPSLFEGLEIEKVEGFKEKYFKKCNVFYLDLKIKKNQHVFDVILRAFKDCFDTIKNHFPDCKLEFNAEKLEKSLTNLMRYLRKKEYDCPRYAFIDEYDSALMELNEIFRNESETDDNRVRAKRYADEIYEFLDTGNETFGCRFFLTGVVSLEYDDLFSDSRMIFSQSFSCNVKPFHQYHLISMEKFLSLNGFDTPPTEEEQAKLIKWYGGYTLVRFDEVIGNYLNLYSLIKCYEEGNFFAYFNTSGCTRWLRKYLEREYVILCINEILFAKDDIIIDLKRKPLLNGGRNHVLSILVHCGYLVLVKKIADPCKYIVKIPNKETRMVLDELVQSVFSNYFPVENETLNHNLYEAFVSGSEERLEVAIQNFFAAIQGIIRYEETYCLLLLNTLKNFTAIKCHPFNTPAGSGLCDGVVMYKNKGYVVECKIIPHSRLPAPDVTKPEDYNAFCTNESNKLLTRAENQHINQEYISFLKGHTEITDKYRLLLAFIQKRVFLKLTQIN